MAENKPQMSCNKLIKKFFEEIFENNPFDEPESPQASGSKTVQGNKAIRLLLSKAVKVLKERPASSKEVGDWTYKDVDKLKLTEPENYKLWHEAMKGEVKALDD